MTKISDMPKVTQMTNENPPTIRNIEPELTTTGFAMNASPVDLTKSQHLKEHDIRITFHSVGCVIIVGCKSMSFSTAEEGMIALNAYVNNPKEAIEYWNKKFRE
jgi:hypothetical protein